jgi:hypothetical protein
VLKIAFETKKTRIDYMNKANVNHIKTLEIKLALWLTPLLFPRKWPKS